MTLVKQLRDDIGYQRNEISYLRQLIENCTTCQNKQPIRESCQTHNRCYPGRTCTAQIRINWLMASSAYYLMRYFFPIGVQCYDTSAGTRCGHCPRGYIGDGKHCRPGQSCSEKPCFRWENYKGQYSSKTAHGFRKTNKLVIIFWVLCFLMVILKICFRKIIPKLSISAAVASPPPCRSRQIEILPTLWLYLHHNLTDGNMLISSLLRLYFALSLSGLCSGRPPKCFYFFSIKSEWCRSSQSYNTLLLNITFILSSSQHRPQRNEYTHWNWTWSKFFIYVVIPKKKLLQFKIIWRDPLPRFINSFIISGCRISSWPFFLGRITKMWLLPYRLLLNMENVPLRAVGDDGVKQLTCSQCIYVVCRSDVSLISNCVHRLEVKHEFITSERCMDDQGLAWYRVANIQGQ